MKKKTEHTFPYTRGRKYKADRSKPPLPFTLVYVKYRLQGLMIHSHAFLCQRSNTDKGDEEGKGTVHVRILTLKFIRLQKVLPDCIYTSGILSLENDKEEYLNGISSLNDETSCVTF